MKGDFHLTTIEALWVLGLINTNELPGVANKALAHGLESKSLYELAILEPETSQDTRCLFQKALEELGCGNMSKVDALRHYAKNISDQILSSGLLPVDGAKMIWRATLANQVSQFHDLDPFIYAVSELEDRPKDRMFFEKAIIAEAKRWSNSGKQT